MSVELEYRSVNPMTGEVLGQYPFDDELLIEKRLVDAKTGYESFAKWDSKSRARQIISVADRLDGDGDAFAKLISEEMGKPIKQAKAEIEKSAKLCRFYATKADGMLADLVVKTEAKNSFVRFQSLGTILGIMPWNFPFWQVVRFAVPALVTGNTVLLKHAPNVPECAKALTSIFQEAGFRDGIFQHLFTDNEATGTIIADPRIAAVTLTGSVRAGSAVAAKAGAAIKKTVLELGGSDAFIVLNDADIKQAIKTGIKSRFLNTGQSCIGAKRFILHHSIADEFIGGFAEAAAALRVGDPMEASTDIGPLAREDLRDALQKQVDQAVEQGATLLMGGEPVDGPGYFYPPTMLTDVKPGSVTFEEEVFGPVASFCVVDSEEDAIELANDSEYGLGATVFTRDRARGERVATELDAGCTFVNQMVASDQRLPFGGIKKSGYGRELAAFGLKEFVNVKTVWID